MSAEREGLERVARKLHELETREGCATVEWSDMPEQHRDMYRKDAAEVLALLDGGERPSEPTEVEGPLVMTDTERCRLQAVDDAKMKRDVGDECGKAFPYGDGDLYRCERPKRHPGRCCAGVTPEQLAARLRAPVDPPVCLCDPAGTYAAYDCPRHGDQSLVDPPERVGEQEYERYERCPATGRSPYRPERVGEQFCQRCGVVRATHEPGIPCAGATSTAAEHKWVERVSKASALREALEEIAQGAEYHARGYLAEIARRALEDTKGPGDED